MTFGFSLTTQDFTTAAGIWQGYTNPPRSAIAAGSSQVDLLIPWDQNGATNEFRSGIDPFPATNFTGGTFIGGGYMEATVDLDSLKWSDGKHYATARLGVGASISVNHLTVTMVPTDNAVHARSSCITSTGIQTINYGVVAGVDPTAIALRIETSPGTMDFYVGGTLVASYTIDDSSTAGNFWNSTRQGALIGVGMTINDGLHPLSTSPASISDFSYFWRPVLEPVDEDVIESEWHVYKIVNDSIDTLWNVAPASKYYNPNITGQFKSNRSAFFS